MLLMPSVLVPVIFSFMMKAIHPRSPYIARIYQTMVNSSIAVIWRHRDVETFDDITPSQGMCVKFIRHHVLYAIKYDKGHIFENARNNDLQQTRNSVWTTSS